MLDRPRYFLARALRNMSGSPFLCSAAILTMAVALTSVGVFFLVVLNLQALTANWQEDIQVLAFLERTPAAGELQQRLDLIRGFPEVEEVRFVDSRQALERFRTRLGQDSDLLEGIAPDVLPPSLEVALKPAARNRPAVQQVVTRLESEAGLTDLQYGKDWLEQFESFTNLVRLVGAVLGGFLVFAAVFIASNTIKLTLYARRDELEIMTLVGATLRFIKTPFLLEGLFQGLLAGGLALGLLSLVYHLLLRDSLQILLLAPTGFTIHFLPPAYQLAIAAAGAVLGVLGSLLALRKFVRI